MEEKNKVKIVYTNWRGETATRTIIPKKLIFVKTDWHPEEQWCIKAQDVDKDAERTFACKDIKSWNVK
jgi:predicted DNA-binding transcriptional regulator YafY